MAALQFPRTARWAGWLSSGILLLGSLGLAVRPAVAQDAAPDPSGGPVSDVRPADLTGDLSIAAGDRLVTEAGSAIAAQNNELAIDKLVEARDLFNRLAGYYRELASSFIGINTRQADSNRALALEAAQKRDQTSYQLALLYRAQNRPEEAVPLLMEILRSQQPTRDLGRQAYQQLYELGFVEAPFGDGAGSGQAAASLTNLTVDAGDRLVAEASDAISAQNYPLAITKFQEARTLYGQVAGYYQDLAGMFIGIDNGQAESNRTLARDAAQKRDQTTYQLALLYRSQNRPEDAIPLLMDILRSQQPTRELGQQAYQQLYELGFVEAPFSRGGS
jgi:DNA polymerase III psi subunit